VTAEQLDLLALFPSFESPVFGGVQASGREAWRSITGCPTVSSGAWYYEPANGRLAAAYEALRKRVSANTILVWHCGLLRLVPLIAPRRKRLVIFLHGIEAWKKQDYVTTLLMQHASLFLTNSDHTWRRFTAVHPNCAGSPHTTVHLGAGELEESFPYPENGSPAALMIGRLSSTENYKGHREMIQIWPRVLEHIPGARLWIVVEGDLRPQLEQMARSLSLSAQVKFFGAIPDVQKDDLLKRCRAMLLPSAGEGFGLVYLEAMRMGRPCLVSTLDAGREVVNPPEAGLAVDLKDAAGTLQSVLKLLTAGRHWDAMSTRARARYAAHFTAGHFRQRLTSALFAQ
jgi:phosphatidylinositol alpha-1,6-mannosyltransferase